MGEKKHINKIHQKIPGQSREMFVYVFCSSVAFLLPKYLSCFCQASCHALLQVVSCCESRTNAGIEVRTVCSLCVGVGSLFAVVFVSSNSPP